MTKDEALKLALEALDGLYMPNELERVNKAILAINEALAQPSAQAEPVFWGIKFGAGVYAGYAYPHKRTAEQLSAVSNQPNTVVPLYTTPQPASQHLLKLVAEREACALVCEKQIKIFLSSQYKTGQPLSSFGERHAAATCATVIKARGQA